MVQGKLNVLSINGPVMNTSKFNVSIISVFNGYICAREARYPKATICTLSAFSLPLSFLVTVGYSYNDRFTNLQCSHNLPSPICTPANLETHKTLAGNDKGSNAVGSANQQGNRIHFFFSFTSKNFSPFGNMKLLAFTSEA